MPVEEDVAQRPVVVDGASGVVRAPWKPVDLHDSLVRVVRRVDRRRDPPWTDRDRPDLPRVRRLPALAQLHPRYRTPWLAIVVQSTWSCILALTGTYERLIAYVVFADWIFFGLTVGTVLVFRRMVPLSQRPPDSYRAPGYPVIQILFCLIAAAVVFSVVRDDPPSAFRGALLLALGVPVYFWFIRKR